MGGAVLVADALEEARRSRQALLRKGHIVSFQLDGDFGAESFLRWRRRPRRERPIDRDHGRGTALERNSTCTGRCDAIAAPSRRTHSSGTTSQEQHFRLHLCRQKSVLWAVCVVDWIQLWFKNRFDWLKCNK